MHNIDSRSQRNGRRPDTCVRYTVQYFDHHRPWPANSMDFPASLTIFLPAFPRLLTDLFLAVQHVPESSEPDGRAVDTSVS